MAGRRSVGRVRKPAAAASRPRVRKRRGHQHDRLAVFRKHAFERKTPNDERTLVKTEGAPSSHFRITAQRNRTPTPKRKEKEKIEGGEKKEEEKKRKKKRRREDQQVCSHQRDILAGRPRPLQFRLLVNRSERERGRGF